jgi:hypothetical protein
MGVDTEAGESSRGKRPQIKYEEDEVESYRWEEVPDKKPSRRKRKAADYEEDTVLYKKSSRVKLEAVEYEESEVKKPARKKVKTAGEEKRLKRFRPDGELLLRPLQFGCH